MHIGVVAIVTWQANFFIKIDLRSRIANIFSSREWLRRCFLASSSPSFNRAFQLPFSFFSSFRFVLSFFFSCFTLNKCVMQWQTIFSVLFAVGLSLSLSCKMHIFFSFFFFIVYRCRYLVAVVVDVCFSLLLSNAWLKYPLTSAIRVFVVLAEIGMKNRLPNAIAMTPSHKWETIADECKEQFDRDTFVQMKKVEKCTKHETQKKKSKNWAMEFASVAHISFFARFLLLISWYNNNLLRNNCSSCFIHFSSLFVSFSFISDAICTFCIFFNFSETFSFHFPRKRVKKINKKKKPNWI